MADTLYDVTSGFYDSIDQDRLYTAAQMNMPYKRLISEGVFATPAGTASTDFQVLAVSERNVKVCAGNAILGEKWVESNADQPITIGGNTTGNPRIDSIILRVDRNNTERKASIIYRTGEAAASPTAPALNTGANIYELRLADILVASGTNTISQSAITDQRGSAECPWITSLIYQVDTSTLFEQYQAAQEEQFETFETNWENFIDTLDRQETSGVTATTGTVTTVASVGIPKAYSMKSDFGITDYDPTGDIIMLYINGLYAIEGDKWELVPTADPEDPSISFADGTTAGQNLYMVVLKPVAPGGGSMTPITNAQIDALFE